jgi:putative iron-only hydrogenase system regulator
LKGSKQIIRKQWMFMILICCLLLEKAFFMEVIMDKKIAVISAILEEPQLVQSQFNQIISEFKGIVRGRTGIPFDQHGISVVTIIVIGSMDEINGLTGKLGNLKSVLVKTSVSKKTILE